MLRSSDHDVIAASPKTGIDAITGEGLGEALAGADTVIDVANSSTLEDEAPINFFMTLSRSLLAAETAADIRHHITLSLVGADRIRDSSYFRAKAAQEDFIRGSPIPYTIVRSTQSFEFIERVLRASIDGGVVRVPPALMQPVAKDDVAEFLAQLAVSPPLNETIEMGGPETFPLKELARLLLSAHAEPRNIVEDPRAPYFGAMLAHRSLVLSPAPKIGASTFGDWLRQQFITPD
jgi:uncharacterized protein YbjT (DUF2867 family)